jgi:hypothetical protein
MEWADDCRKISWNNITFDAVVEALMGLLLWSQPVIPGMETETPP